LPGAAANEEKDVFVVPKVDVDKFKLPAHPTLLFAEYGKQRLPVVAASKNLPVVVIGGKREILKETTPLLTQRAATYGPASAEMSGGITHDEWLQLPPSRSDGLGGATRSATQFDLTLTFTAAQDLEDCYLVLIGFDVESLLDAETPDSSTISVREIGSLKAGEPKTLNFTARVIFPLKFANGDPWKKQIGAGQFKFTVMPLVWQLFSGGVQVKTKVSEYAPLFFYHRERMAHHAAVKAWRQENRKGNQPVRPVLQIPPLLESTAGFPAEATATLSIAADGTVTQVVLDQAFPDPAKEVLTTTLGAWLFLPAIKNGVAVPVRIRVPLEF